MSAHSVAAVILHKNAAAALERTLADLQWCDQRIIVDDFSNFPPTDIAKKYNALLTFFPVSDDFSKARKHGELLAKTEWVLWIDSDESVSPELAQELQSAVKRSDIAGVRLKRFDIFMGRLLTHGEIGAVRLVRMCRKGKGKWQRAVHEVLQVEGTLLDAGTPLIHRSHTSLESFLEKIIVYAEKAAKQKQVSPLQLWLELFLYPTAKFLQNYILRAGFKDGLPGFVMAYMMSLHSLLVRVYRLEDSRNHAD